MADAKPLAPGSVLKSDLGQYTVIRVLGLGGFGITYLVEATVKIGNITGRMKFAIKEHYVSLLCERDGISQSITFSDSASATVEKSRRTFVKEAQRVKNLGIEHPNIVPINEVFEANNTAYYVMEYLEGETLQEYVKRRGALSYAETLEIMRPIVDAVKTLHHNNIAHYDIKPANIILSQTHDGRMRPVLIDFGLSKHYDDDGDPTSTLGSGGYTSGYAAIEQHAGLSTYNPQSDVYALAATMYYCLVGKKPPIAHEFDVRALPALLGDKAPAEFVTTLQQAMAYSKNDRIPNAIEFYDRVYEGKQPQDTVSPMVDNTRIAYAGRTLLGSTPDVTRHSAPATPVPPVLPPAKSFYSNENDKPRRRSKAWIWIVALLLLGGIGICGYFLFKDSKKDIASVQPKELTLAERYIAAIKEYPKASDKKKAAGRINIIIREINSLTDKAEIKAFEDAMKIAEEDNECVEAWNVLARDWFNGEVHLENIIDKTKGEEKEKTAEE